MEEESKKKRLMASHDETTAVRYLFDSLLDLIDWLSLDWIEEGTKQGQSRENWHSHGSMSKSFCPLSWEKAMEEAQFGEAKKAEDFSRILEEISSRMEADLPQWTHNLTGQCLDIGAFCAGEPECFLRKAPRPAMKSIPVYVDMSMPWKVSSSTILTRAAAIVSMVDSLQTMGWIVDLHVCTRTKLYERKKPLVIDVAVDCRPVDVNILSFLCSPAFLRRCCFACFEHYTNQNDPESYGKGEQLDRPQEPGFLFVGGYDSEWCSSCWSSPEEAKKHVQSMIQAYMTPKEGKEMEVVVG